MTIALVTSLKGTSPDFNGFTTGSANTTGANLLVLGLATAANSGAISDSKGNTWVPLTQYMGAFSDRWFQFFYVLNPTVGSGHTFSVTGTTNFPSLIISAWSGVATSSAFDVENGNGGGFTTSVSTGSVTPSADNELLIAGLNYDNSNTPTIDLGFTILQTVLRGDGGGQGQQMAYLIETTAAAKNPTFSWTDNSRAPVAIATFKAAGAAAANPSRIIQARQAVKRAANW